MWSNEKTAFESGVSYLWAKKVAREASNIALIDRESRRHYDALQEEMHSLIDQHFGFLDGLLDDIGLELANKMVQAVICDPELVRLVDEGKDTIWAGDKEEDNG